MQSSIFTLLLLQGLALVAIHAVKHIVAPHLSRRRRHKTSGTPCLLKRIGPRFISPATRTPSFSSYPGATRQTYRTTTRNWSVYILMLNIFFRRLFINSCKRYIIFLYFFKHLFKRNKWKKSYPLSYPINPIKIKKITKAKLKLYAILRYAMLFYAMI